MILPHQSSAHPENTSQIIDILTGPSGRYGLGLALIDTLMVVGVLVLLYAA